MSNKAVEHKFITMVTLQHKYISFLNSVLLLEKQHWGIMGALEHNEMVFSIFSYVIANICFCKKI